MNTLQARPSLRWIALAGLLACLAGGTAQAQSSAKGPLAWVPGMDSKPQTPASVVAVWTNAMLQQPGAPPTRGFGGRLMFYGPGSDKPIRVDGTLVVYAFDELRRDPHDPQPDRKYVFRREQLGDHYSKSKLGPSYSVWIPWDKAGSPPQQVSLIVRFNPASGPAIVGNQTKLALPGHTTPLPQAPAPSKQDSPQPREADATIDDVRPAAHFMPSRPKMDTMTIPIPAKGQ